MPAPMAVLICLCLVFASQVACGSATRLEPISGILDAFKSHHIVALGEGLHGNLQSHAFRLSLIRDPRFAATVNDIVVEFGSARYQAVMDRFISSGDVSHAELQKAWQDTTQNGLWDDSIYEEFFRAVRELNASLPRERQLRVLLGDPPIDWDNVRTHSDYMHWNTQRDTHAADLIDREVVSRNRRALVIYGDGHFRRVPRFAGTSLTAPTLVNLIERRGTRVLTVWTNTTVELERLQWGIKFWPIPSLTLLRGTKLGALNFRVLRRNGNRSPDDNGRPGRMLSSTSDPLRPSPCLSLQRSCAPTPTTRRCVWRAWPSVPEGPPDRMW